MSEGVSNVSMISCVSIARSLNCESSLSVSSVCRGEKRKRYEYPE